MLRPLLLAIVFAVGFSPSGETRQTADPEARLRLYHTHTGERIDIVYRRGGIYVLFPSLTASSAITAPVTFTASIRDYSTCFRTSLPQSGGPTPKSP